MTLGTAGLAVGLLASAKFRVVANEIHVSGDGALTTCIGNVHVETHLNGSMVSLRDSKAVVIK